MHNYEFMIFYKINISNYILVLWLIFTVYY